MQHPAATPPPSDWYGVTNSVTPDTKRTAPSQLRSPNRKSPPPPPINLDDCRPVFTDGRVSGSSSAFVFTSSRTLRAQQHARDVREILPSQSTTPSPTGSSASTTRQYPVHKQRPSLSQAQLARHSEGAVDTRTTLGPNMRAAGFVHLSQSILPSNHAMLHGSQPTSPVTPTSSDNAASVLTPCDPPPFPPIMFVAPSVVATTPMWNYQREMDWSLGANNTSSGLPSIAEMSPRQAHPVASSSKLQTTLASPVSISTSRAPSTVGSSATLFSSTAVSQSTSGLSASTLVSSLAQQKAKGRALDPEFGLNEYPFPRTYSSQAHSRLPVVSWGSTGPSPLPIATAVSTSSSTSASRLSSHHTRRSSHQSSPAHHSDAKDKDKVKEKDKEKNRSKGKDKIKLHEGGREKDKQRSKAVHLQEPPPPQHKLSLTELCDMSHFSWDAQQDVFSSSGSSRSVSRTTTSISSGAVASSSSVSEPKRTRGEAHSHMHPHTHVHKDASSTDAHVRRSSDSAKESSESERSDPVPVIVPALLLPKAHVHARELDRADSYPHGADRGRDVVGKPLTGGAVADVATGEVGRREKKHLEDLVRAHRERDRQDARHTAAERERHGFKQKRKTKEKSASVYDDEEPSIAVIVPSPVYEESFLVTR
ncbi:hypothetical protein B0H21DRAFT_22992 [Amylocystis lapponica]|nr:hypothetical protein B0H21DRAFT_22992 [Amylocystis lapponica]